ncbi:hypothetical protein ACFYYR_30750 [Streptomyces sp. NPDC001922]|uniref:hypothetical protein n=1 Tax=Streptomyces sp. NPDC001922 TaxID=3364624 RepID=UPI0036887A71
MTAEGAFALDDLAAEFANKLTALTRGVLGEDSPQFHAVNAGSRIRVSPISDTERVHRIPITIGGQPRLSLMACYYCCWDGSSTFLATDKANLHLFYEKGSEPLLRFEYERTWTDPPGAHIQVHAHRDEMAYLLRLADSGRPGFAMKRDKLPRLAEMHLPVGGHRMRPSLEDVLLFLEREFSIDTRPGWRAVVEEHLVDWRLMQMKSAVRDAPEEAAETLRLLGYTVEPPKVVRPRTERDVTKLFLP